MVPVPLDIKGIDCQFNARDGVWDLTACGERHVLRSWTWAERARLTRASCGPDGVAHAAFFAGFCDLVFDPPPHENLRPLFTCIGLHLLGVRDDAEVVSLDEYEERLAQRFGWTPGMMAAEDPARLDALARPIQTQAAAAAGGWTTLTLDDGTNPGGAA